MLFLIHNFKSSMFCHGNVKNNDVKTKHAKLIKITHYYFTIGLSYLSQYFKTTLYHLTSHLPTIDRELLVFLYFYFIYPRIHRNKKLIYVLLKKKTTVVTKKYNRILSNDKGQ